MTTIHSYTRWDLEALRAGKAERDRDGDSMPFLDAKLAEAEAQFAAGALNTETDRPDAPAARPANPAGASSYRSDGPTAAQLRFITTLCDQLGRDADDRPTPRTKREASTMIDALKAQADRARRNGTRTAPPAKRLATEGQINFLRDLYTTREFGVELATPVDEVNWAGLEFDAASTLIEAWKPLPRKQAAAPEHGIRAGRYAYQPAEGHAQFYRVTRTGRILVQAGPAEHPYNGKLNEALLAIKADPRAGAELYGRLIGSCGRCGLALTDEDSRALGLGPICAGKTEW